MITALSALLQKTKYVDRLPGCVFFSGSGFLNLNPRYFASRIGWPAL